MHVDTRIQMKDKKIFERSYVLNDGVNGGESLTLQVDFLSNGEPNGIFMNQQLILQSYGNSASFNLYGSTLYPDKLRQVADFIDLATSHAKEIAKKEQEEQEQKDSDGHYALVPLTEFVDNGGILEKHREIFTEFQGRFYSKLLDHYENGIVYVKQYPDDEGEALSETAYVKCPAQVQYK